MEKVRFELNCIILKFLNLWKVAYLYKVKKHVFQLKLIILAKIVQALTSSLPAVKKYWSWRALNPVVIILARALEKGTEKH